LYNDFVGITQSGAEDDALTWILLNRKTHLADEWLEQHAPGVRSCQGYKPDKRAQYVHAPDSQGPQYVVMCPGTYGVKNVLRCPRPHSCGFSASRSTFHRRAEETPKRQLGFGNKKGVDVLSGVYQYAGKRQQKYRYLRKNGQCLVAGQPFCVPSNTPQLFDRFFFVIHL
jgi:hypothetical protein